MKRSGKRVCQNGVLATSPNINIDMDEIIERYMSNFITEAIVIAGLEPFDSFSELYELISKFRCHTDDDIVIYTGYYPNEIKDYLNDIKQYKKYSS